MKLIGKLCLLPLLLLVHTGSTCAQKKDILPVPLDERIRTAKLDNGLTYYIMSNKEPEKRASFYLVQNVGSLLEEDNQNGLAHFLEHMAFQGTKHFPGKGIISSLEKHGVAFGSNINAYTYYYETVYNLSDVPVDQPGLLDTCLLILNDWSDYLLLSDEEIDAERGVIIEEWRTRRTAGFRQMEKYMPVLLKGSKYPDRDIIGDLEILKSFDYQTLRDFYRKWYRTDLQAVIVVGDFDADEMENKVKKLFSVIPPLDSPETLPFFEIPAHKETLYALATDKEATQHSVDLYIKHRAVEPGNKGMNYLREQYVRTLFNSMMQARINEILQKGVPPFITGSVNYSSFLRGYDVYSMGVTARQNEDSLAFDAIYREAERAKRFGFTEGELQRAKEKMLSSWDSYYKQRDKIDNDSYASAMQSHFLINEPLAPIDFEYNTVKKLIPEISLEELSQKASEWFTEENRVIIVQGPEAEGESYLSEEQSLSIIENVSSSRLEPYTDSVAGNSLISEVLPGADIVSTIVLREFDALEWTLGNGVRVIYRHADYEKDNVSLSAFSPGGISLVDEKELPSAQMLPGMADAYGAGELSNVDLQKYLSGKRVSVSFSLGSLTENISASSTPEDLETMFQLLYLKFARPRFDSEAHNALLSRYNAVIAQMDNNPQKIMQDSLSLILSSYHTRTRLLNKDFLSEVDFEQIKKIYTERFSDADDFIFIIVGNIEEEVLKPMVKKYLGSLESQPAEEEWVDWKIKAPEGLTDKTISMEMAIPKATVLVYFSNDLEYTAYNRQALRIINGILNLRYDETIREEEGGTYGVSSTVSVEQYPASAGTASIVFECDPERAEELKDIVHREIDRLCEDGPEQTDLAKTIQNILKVREESKSHNSYWLSGLYNYYYRGINYTDPANFEDLVTAFTPDDIREVARQLFKNADRVDIIFKPPVIGE